MRAILAMLAPLLLAGCGGFTRDAPAPAVYVLTAPPMQPGPAAAADLLVLRPAAVPSLATARIATLWPGNRVDYYAGARWSGDLGSVVQAALVEACRRSGRLRTVQADPSSFQATHVLGVDIERFEADYTGGGPPVARVRMTVTVARASDRKALGSWTASAEQPASADTLTAVTAALDTAFDTVAAGLVGHAADAVAADAPRQP